MQRHAQRMELPIEREDVQAIMGSLLDLHWKLDQIIGYLLGEDKWRRRDGFPLR
jgi:hypothetical protein